MQYQFLTARERAIIAALMPIVLPESPADPGAFTRRLLFHADRFLQHLTPILRTFFHLGAFVFDVGPMPYLLSRKPFRKSSAGAREAWVRRVYRRGAAPLYRWFVAIRGVILLYYYSQDEQSQKLGYQPAAWARDRVMRRRQQLHIIEEAYVPKSSSKSESA